MKVAYFLRSLDLIFSQEKECDIFPICPENSEEIRVAETELKLDNIIPIKIGKKELNFSELKGDAVFKNSNLAQQLKKYKIDCFFPRNSTPYIKNWGDKNKIIILSPPYQLREKFENKIYFEKLLRKSGLARIRSEFLNSKNAPFPFPKTVVQSPASTGGEGTFVVNDQNSFKKAVRKLQLPLLAREYKDGLPLSSSIFIKDKRVYLTGVERQCYLKTEGKSSFGLFIGIQWLPYVFFSPKIYRNIENDLLEIGANLEKLNLSGLLNIDFILDKNGGVNFIECNPRIACATNQIMANEGLRNGESFLNLLLSHYVKSFKYERRTGAEHLPKSLFTGSQMFISFPNFINFNIKLKSFKPGGFYILKNGALKKLKLKNRFDFLKLKNGLFFSICPVS